MATPSPEPTPLPGDVPMPGATPTIDRLAAPPTVPAPTQADEGQQLFWLHCQPCHGDQGQGLTDEWRAQYPIEDQNCWNSGCHGERPYGQDFVLPTAVPAVIGDGTLTKYETVDGLYRYISVSMPYFFPGDLTQEEYLAITAHLAREHGVWDGRPLTEETLAAYRLQPATPEVIAANPPSHAAAQPPHESGGGMGRPAAVVVLGLLGLLIIVGISLWQRRSH